MEQRTAMERETWFCEPPEVLITLASDPRLPAWLREVIWYKARHGVRTEDGCVVVGGQFLSDTASIRLVAREDGLTAYDRQPLLTVR